MNTKNGNVLFLILLAVALFAALSYTVTQSNRSGGNNISSEDTALIASRLVQYATGVESAVSRMRLINSCSPSQISGQFDWDEDGTLEDNNSDLYNPYAPRITTSAGWVEEGGYHFVHVLVPR